MTEAIDELIHFSPAARDGIESALRDYTEFDAGCPETLREAIRHSLLAPGKRLRPMLVLMAAEACGSPWEAALPAACAVEMVHTYSLIHDDLPAMDDDDLRRGRPTCHKVFGEAAAILAGDALLARAFEILARDIHPPAVAARCCAELAHAAGATMLVGGQADDLAAEFKHGDLERLERIHHRKTGAMFRVSARLGGTVAGAEEFRLNSLDRYARNLGLAFQIIDDLLDVKGKTVEVGKRVEKDSARGKLTFPRFMGAAASRQRAEQLIDDACAAMSGFSAKGETLVALARFVVERNR